MNAAKKRNYFPLLFFGSVIGLPTLGFYFFGFIGGFAVIVAGLVWFMVIAVRLPASPAKAASAAAPGRVCCPKCRSEQVFGGTKGFGVGKATAGVILAGPIGAAVGVIGRNKVMVNCLSCGHRWKAAR